MDCEFKEVINRDCPPKDGDSWSVCHMLGEDDEVLETHVVPINDNDGHEWGLSCHCDPQIEYYCPETGDPYECPLIAHNAFDGRHVLEDAKMILNQ